MEKYFTLEEANRALALVSPIVQDVLRKMGEINRIHDAVKTEQARDQMSESLILEQLDRAEKLLNEVEHHMNELRDVGVLLKDLKMGLVDFPCMHNDDVIYLCWMFGEREITCWHHIGESYMNRKAVDKNFSAHVSA